MAGILDGVDQRTQLAGQNRLELLLFFLGTKQRFGINVFKVQEVIHCPTLTHMPHSHPTVRGVAHMRGKTVPVLDLSMAIGQSPLEEGAGRFVIVTEYNRTVQGFLVGGVDKIVNMEWKAILPPPKGSGKNTYMTAVTNVEDELVEIIDVEKVLSEVHEVDTVVSDSMIEEVSMAGGDYPKRILVADDSSVARNQIKRTIEQLGVEVILANDGKQALEKLKAMADEGGNIQDQLLLVISDIEMPEMDGYTFTTEIRGDERLKNLHVILHTSLSGVFNETLIKKVGANRFVAKFSADELSGSVVDYIKSIGGEI